MTESYTVQVLFEHRLNAAVVLHVPLANGAGAHLNLIARVARVARVSRAPRLQCRP